jgi:hypothetical protein
MSTEIALLGDLPEASRYGENDAFKDEYAKASAFLPRLKFYSAASPDVKRKIIPENHFFFIKNKNDKTDLGENFLGFMLAYRYLAVDFREQGKAKSYYDPNSPEFKEVAEHAKKKYEGNQMNPCSAGAQFLIYVKDQGLATLHCNNNSLKKLADKLFAMLKPRTFASFGHATNEWGNLVWEAVTAVKHSGSFDIKIDKDKLTREIKNFSEFNGNVEEVEETETTAEAGRTR